jgi:hypothetical protein
MFKCKFQNIFSLRAELLAASQAKTQLTNDIEAQVLWL